MNTVSISHHGRFNNGITFREYAKNVYLTETQCKSTKNARGNRRFDTIGSRRLIETYNEEGG